MPLTKLYSNTFLNIFAKDNDKIIVQKIMKKYSDSQTNPIQTGVQFRCNVSDGGKVEYS